MHSVPAMQLSNSTAKLMTDLETLVSGDGALKRTDCWLDARISTLADVPDQLWDDLCRRLAEPNAFYDPAWCRAFADHADLPDGVTALVAWDDRMTQLIGVLPVHNAKRAINLPLPLLVAWPAYAPLTTPLLDKEKSAEAAGVLIEAAAATGACALLLPDMTIAGPSFSAIETAAAARGIRPHILRRYHRAEFDATQDAETLLHAALGNKKLKELRRQAKRLADSGPVEAIIASAPQDVARALEEFLALEIRGWKGRRGTAMAKENGDASFIRQAAHDLAAKAQCQIITLKRGDTVLASGLVLRQADRAFFFKLAFDENEAKASPGVQLTLELTRHLCADPQIRSADSTADADHPMIDRIWRGRLAMGDVFIPLRPGDPVTALSRNLIIARNAARDCARPIVRLVRKMKDQLA